MAVTALVLSIVSLLSSSYLGWRSHTRDQHDFERGLADLTACWVSTSDDMSQVRIHIRNGSAQPIRQVHATIRQGYVDDYQPEPVSDVGGMFAGSIGPSETIDWLVTEIENWHKEILIASGSLPLEVHFTDANGRGWTRTVKGLLVKREIELGGFC